MSWITDLAGKAEDFLVKIDKSAADRLTKERGGTPGHSRQHSSASVTSVASVSSVTSKSSDNLAHFSKPQSTNLKSSVSSPDTLKLSKSKVDLDAVLMESLNNDDSVLEVNANQTPVQPLKSNGLSLEQENTLLNQEIKALNQEMRQTAQSVRQAEKDARLAQQQLKAQIATAKSLEEEMYKLRKENMSLADSILDKDAEITTLKSKLKSVDIEQEHRGTLEAMHAQLESESKLKESLEKDIKLQASQFEKEKSSWLALSEEVKQQLELVKEELSSTQQSFNEYKVRAQRILQDKDRLLQDMKQQNKDDGIQPSELLMAELEQLQQERDLLREETAQSNAQLQQSRKELTAIQKRFEEEIRSLRSTNGSIEARLSEEKSRRELAESESKNLTEELRYVREDVAQQKVQSAGRIQQLESELAKIRQQLTSKQNSASSPTQAELEQRLRVLTETLVAKQAALEAVQSERSSLVLQLERANKTLETGLCSPQNDSSTRIMLNITDDERAKVTSGVSRRVRSAYSSLDSLNFRLGQALRRRPAARLILFFYMVVLHFWVAFVLLTYSPEMHEKDH